MSELWLLIDADDTLWENNIYFERAFDEFVNLLNHSYLSKDQVRKVLDSIESTNIQTHGYGSENFGRNMQQCYRYLAEYRWSEDDLNAVMVIAQKIREHSIELLEGVQETLPYLAKSHRLTLYSKGQFEEQNNKIERSGLKRYFQSCRIVKEKNADGYRNLLAENTCSPETTWMIGNSPKSDINPALEAGLGAVLIPHQFTWQLEHEALPEQARRLHIVRSFGDLRHLF